MKRIRKTAYEKYIDQIGAPYCHICARNWEKPKRKPRKAKKAKK